MTLLAVERTKLFSTRSPWWCAVVALALTIGFAALLAGYASGPVPLQMSLAGYQLGMMVVMVLAALAVTTEYRFGTIRATFLAVPDRVSALVAKTCVVAATAFVIGELAAFGSLGVTALLASESDLALSGAAEWRQVAGVGLVYALAAVLSVGVGVLLRQSAGAVTLLLLWPLLIESLVMMIPNIGEDLYSWMPFHVVDTFLGSVHSAGMSSDVPFGPWGSLAYFAVFVVLVLLIGFGVVRRRDA